MRIAEYAVPHAAGDTEDGECVVSTLGGGGAGGSIDRNIDRWIRQFDPAGASTPKRATRDVEGMHVTTFDMAGTYLGMRMPGAPPATPKANYRLLGAVVETPSGLWFFKLTGPTATMLAAASEFDGLISSLRK
jgi:hypothetical protein